MKSDNDYAWEILNLIFRDGNFYIDTLSPNERIRLCIDGTDYSITNEQLTWLEATFWTDDGAREEPPQEDLRALADRASDGHTPSRERLSFLADNNGDEDARRLLIERKLVAVDTK